MRARGFSSCCALLLCCACMAQGPDSLNRLESWSQRSAARTDHPKDAILIEKKFYCPKAFVPARPGGFRHTEAKMGCCVLDASLEVAESIYMMHECGFAFGDGFKADADVLGRKRAAEFERDCRTVQPLPKARSVEKCCSVDGAAHHHNPRKLAHHQHVCRMTLAGVDKALVEGYSERADSRMESVFKQFKQCVDTKEYYTYFSKDPAYAECSELRAVARRSRAWEKEDHAAEFKCLTNQKPTPDTLTHLQDLKARTILECKRAQNALYKAVRQLQTAAYRLYSHAKSDLTDNSKTLLLEPGLPALEKFMQKHNGMEFDLVDKMEEHDLHGLGGSTEKAFIKAVHMSNVKHKLQARAMQKFHEREIALEQQDLQKECELHPLSYAGCRQFFSQGTWEKLMFLEKGERFRKSVLAQEGVKDASDLVAKCKKVAKAGVTPHNCKQKDSTCQNKVHLLYECFDVLGSRDNFYDPKWDYYCSMHKDQCNKDAKDLVPKRASTPIPKARQGCTAKMRATFEAAYTAFGSCIVLAGQDVDGSKSKFCQCLDTYIDGTAHLVQLCPQKQQEMKETLTDIIHHPRLFRHAGLCNRARFWDQEHVNTVEYDGWRTFHGVNSKPTPMPTPPQSSAQSPTKSDDDNPSDDDDTQPKAPAKSYKAPLRKNDDDDKGSGEEHGDDDGSFLGGLASGVDSLSGSGSG